MRLKKVMAWVLILAGALIFLGNSAIFELLVDWIGPEFFVGAEWVIHDADGSVLYTNPGAQVCWAFSIAAVGIATAAAGLLWLLIQRRAARCTS